MMVKVIHSFRNLAIGKEVKDNQLGFMLTNKNGSYAYFNETAQSRYHGLFFFNGRNMYRAVEDVQIPGSDPVTEIRNNFYCIERKRGKITERFFMPSGSNSLVYELNGENEISVTFDVKESYDNRVWGRNYSISVEDGIAVIGFTKTTDSREDQSSGNEEYSFYTAVKNDTGNFKNVSEWIERFYTIDEQRNSPPFSRHVLRGLSSMGKKFAVSVSFSREEAVRECRYVFKNSAKLMEKERKQLDRNAAIIKKTKNKQIKFACLCDLSSLDSLAIHFGNKHGVLAGLPWFFQAWSRDELTSLKALILLEKFSIARSILEKNILGINDDGSIASKENSALNSADALGWLFKRIEDFNLISKNKITMHPNMKKAVDALFTKHTSGNLAMNKPYETWMDTLERADARIEIQALRLSIYRLMRRMTGQNVYKELEEKLKKSVLEKFWNGAYLRDGADDATIRPNSFIAHYIYPDLLSNEEWKKCFDISINALWLEWGGFSTIDKSNPLFCNEHTGEINRSYHNGDSWFWLNNLAASSMLKIDKRHFKKYIKKILDASTNEILWKGAIGHHAELSSAGSLTSRGCMTQAWSAAMYAELVSEINNYG